MYFLSLTSLYLLSFALGTHCFSINDLTSYFYKRSTNDVGLNKTDEFCDENKMMLNLANLEITSPERIILLVTNGRKLPCDTCDSVLKTVRGIRMDQKGCRHTDNGSLYAMLYHGIETFEMAYCRDENFQKAFNENLECYRELHENYIDCEGPPDWFEYTNENRNCEKFNDILSCDYTVTAKLCGTDAAHLFHVLNQQVIAAALKYKCEVTMKEPLVDNPMLFISSSGAEIRSCTRIFYLIIIIVSLSSY